MGRLIKLTIFSILSHLSLIDGRRMRGGYQNDPYDNTNPNGYGNNQFGSGKNHVPAVLTPNERRPLLRYHNRIRQALAMGQLPGTGGRTANGTFPGIINMYKLSWDMTLEDEARLLAGYCRTSLGPSHQHQPYYINTYRTHTLASRRRTLYAAVENWWAQFHPSLVLNHSYVPFHGTPVGGPNGYNAQANAPKWENMAASFMTRMGCSANVCGQGGAVVICLYANDRQMALEPNVFQVGSACRVDADCTTYRRSACRASLCFNLDEQLPPSIENFFREDILFEHNKFRRILAHGRQPNGGGAAVLVNGADTLPPASNMYKLEWSVELEERARLRAQSCPRSGRGAHRYTRQNNNNLFYDQDNNYNNNNYNNNNYNNNNYNNGNNAFFGNNAYNAYGGGGNGNQSPISPLEASIAENVYVDRRTFDRYDFRRRGAILEQAILSWWNKILQFPLRRQCIAQMAQPGCYENLQDFINMAYYRNTEVGCAINHNCENHQSNVVVCLYRKGIKIGASGGDYHPQDAALYPPGRPCVVDSDCTRHHDSLCETRTGLCVKIGDKASAATRRVPLPMSNELTQYIVNAHNQMRQEKAFQSVHASPAPQDACFPTGNNLYELRWCPTLEQRARQIASWCRLERRLEYRFIAENFFFVDERNLPTSKRALMDMALTEWQHESDANLQTNIDVAEKRDMCINYNNMLYGGYVNIACAVNHCINNPNVNGKFWLVVCLFQKGTALSNRDLHTPFTHPCRTHDDCTTYPNSSCNRMTRLCVYNGPTDMHTVDDYRNQNARVFDRGFDALSPSSMSNNNINNNNNGYNDDDYDDNDDDDFNYGMGNNNNGNNNFNNNRNLNNNNGYNNNNGFNNNGFYNNNAMRFGDRRHDYTNNNSSNNQMTNYGEY